jgi:hypothetical protein
MANDMEEAPPAKPEGGEGEEHALFIPPDTPGTEHLQAGDMLRVVGRDPDGAIEIEVASPPKDKRGMFDDYDQNAAPEGGKPMPAEAGIGAPGE